MTSDEGGGREGGGRGEGGWVSKTIKFHAIAANCAHTHTNGNRIYHMSCTTCHVCIYTMYMYIYIILHMFFCLCVHAQLSTLQ